MVTQSLATLGRNNLEAFQATTEEELPKSKTTHQRDFSIGICATGKADNLSSLFRVIEEENLPRNFILKKLILVASGCESSVLDPIKSLSIQDRRIEIVEEGKRRGKANAVNEIIERAKGDFLIFINADALPESGSISHLLEAISRDDGAGMVSGCPIIRTAKKSVPMARILELMWAAHNRCSLELNHLSMGNHSTDELMVVRRKALCKLPQDIVNDGAYIAGVAKRKGFGIRFCNQALVTVDAPRDILGVIGQRRRILFGHIQVWKLTGSLPRTVESLLLISPLLAIRVAVKTMASIPKLIAALPLAIVTETFSLLFALYDSALETERHRIWKRYQS